MALIVGVAQLLYVFNLSYSYFRGPVADANPWKACSLEWCTPDTPPKHGNWGDSMPVVHRWPYDFAVPEAELDYTLQTTPASEVPVHESDHDEVHAGSAEGTGAEADGSSVPVAQS